MGEWYCEERRDAIVRGNLNQDPGARAQNERFLRPVRNQYRSNIRQPPTRTPVEKVALLRLGIYCNRCPRRKHPGGIPEPLIPLAVREHKIKRSRGQTACRNLESLFPRSNIRRCCSYQETSMYFMYLLLEIKR